ncbi:ABC transporter aclQ like protein [Verticillium longisporum]|nr:ABC transporter aclQ like protein [Verticillium longisporum]
MREAVATRQNFQGRIDFGFSAYLASHVGVLLYFLDYRIGPLLLESTTADEQRSLLANGNDNGYASVPNMPSRSAIRTQVSGTGWLDYFTGFKVLFPYLWPKDSPTYQLIVVFCMLLLLCQRTINVLAPLQLGVLVDSLGKGRLPYKEIIIYVVYRALQGNQGAIGAARSVLWIPVSQSLFRRLSTAAFEHVLGLSLEFHLNKKIGEVTSALSRGAAINTFLESFCFQVFPMVFDIFVAGVIFFIKYDAFYTIIVFFIMWSYIFLTIYMAKYRGRQRRDMTIKTREMEAVKTDAILAYETVQHNCAVSRETQRFREHVAIFQRAERLVQWSLNGLNLTQSSIFTLGTALLVGVSAYKICIGEQSVGDFVSLINYFVQLQGPLNFFGTYYNMLQNNLIEAERLLDLFKETPGVVEKRDAVTLPQPRGAISFNEVGFSYQRTKTAIVGESGSGKSTCLRLLYRFYDVSSGSITVDGHDIKDLKLDSLRWNIGVVPQDTVLFNASIMYNLLYAKSEATEADVYTACKAANIHDRILDFPDGYDSKVGERGLKLSGGERQRVAIARAILKDARILLLDEATASLDSHTERQIQDALEQVTSGRTTITIAHRLSTITTSEQIIVLHQGKIAERGTHNDLLALRGKYYAMAPARRGAKGRAPASSLQAAPAPAGHDVFFEPLDWELDEVTPALTRSDEVRSFDLVVACDCIYNDALVEPLVQTSVDACLLRRRDEGATAREPTLCIVAQQLRSPEVFEAWLKAFHRRFRVWRVPDQVVGEGLAVGSGFAVHVGILRD